MASPVNKSMLEKMSLQQLKDLFAVLENYIPEREHEDMAEAQVKLAVYAEKMGYSLSDLVDDAGRKSTRNGRKRSAQKGKKVAPKYRNPRNTAET